MKTLLLFLCVPLICALIGPLEHTKAQATFGCIDGQQEGGTNGVYVCVGGKWVSVPSTGATTVTIPQENLSALPQCKAGEIVMVNPSTGIYHCSEPFDVPPQVSKRTVSNYEFGGMEPPAPPTSTFTDRTCKDKTRVLLMSEDQIWHCYSFARLGQ